MHILEFVDYLVLPTLECMLIKPFRDLYKKDRSVGKDHFMEVMSVIYFYVDPRSSYSYITSDEDRLAAIIELEGLDKKFKIADYQDLIDIYKKHVITASYQLLLNARIAADKVGKFLAKVDLFEEDEKGKPKYTVNSVTTAMKQIPEIVKLLLLTEKLVSKEIEEEGRMRGGNEGKTIFEDGVLD